MPPETLDVFSKSALLRRPTAGYLGFPGTHHLSVQEFELTAACCFESSKLRVMSTAYIKGRCLHPPTLSSPRLPLWHLVWEPQRQHDCPLHQSVRGEHTHWAASSSPQLSGKASKRALANIPGSMKPVMFLKKSRRGPQPTPP